MYTFIDQPVDRLCNGGRFLLWAMRGWAHAVEQGTCPPLALSRGFASMHALPALPDFHLAMAMLNRDGLERISLAPINCQRIIEHEAILIGMWRDLANGDLDRMRETLELLVKTEAVSPIARAMTTVTAKLIAAGFNISGLSAATMKELK